MFAYVASHQETTSGFVPTEQPTHSLLTGPSPALPYRVLLVDDDAKTLQLLRDILENYPDIKIVGQAIDGREAVAMATAYQPDVILMDIVLPYLDGIEATHCIKKVCPRTAIIGLAGQFAPRTYNAMRIAGAAAFMCKNQVLAIHKTIMFALGHWTE
jgi:DNA-binding NarL/FixJ family response regulator